MTWAGFWTWLMILWGMYCWGAVLFWLLPFATGPLHWVTRRLLILGFAFLVIGKWMGFVKWDPKDPIDTRPPYGTGLYATPTPSASPRARNVHRISWKQQNPKK
jgi:hypothetical protein